MIKKLISLLIASLLVTSIAGCSSGTSAPSASTGSTGTADSQASTETVPAATEVKWPKNVEIVVPAAAGGDTDYNARLLASYLSKEIGSNFVVSNVNGNGGATGTRQVKEASADGSSVLFYHSAVVVNQLSGSTDYGFDAFDFACIAAMSPGNVVTVSSKLGVTTLEELFDYTKAHPGELKMAAQTGATSYAISMLLKQAGLDVNIVDAGSASDRLAALLGGHVDIILAAYGSIKDYVSEGDLVPIAMDGGVDLEAVDIKAITSQGYDIKLPFYYFFAFPKGTDPALVEQFSATVKDIVENNTEYQEAIASTYLQAPTFYDSQDGLAKFNEVYDILKDVDFSA